MKPCVEVGGGGGGGGAKPCVGGGLDCCCCGAELVFNGGTPLQFAPHLIASPNLGYGVLHLMHCGPALTFFAGGVIIWKVTVLGEL